MNTISKEEISNNFKILLKQTLFNFVVLLAWITSKLIKCHRHQNSFFGLLASTIGLLASILLGGTSGWLD